MLAEIWFMKLGSCVSTDDIDASQVAVFRTLLQQVMPNIFERFQQAGCFHAFFVPFKEIFRDLLDVELLRNDRKSSERMVDGKTMLGTKALSNKQSASAAVGLLCAAFRFLPFELYCNHFQARMLICIL